MIRVVVYLSGKAECQLLETQLRQLLSRRSNEELDCRFYADPAAARAALLAERADAICWDVTDPAGLAYLAAVRTAGREAFLLVMAAATTCGSYITPLFFSISWWQTGAVMAGR
jgi:hypothetical protein